MRWLSHLFMAAGHAEAGDRRSLEASLKAARDNTFARSPARPRIQALLAQHVSLTNDDIVDELLNIILDARQ